MCEIDDVLHNPLGVALGVLFFATAEKAVRNYRSLRKCPHRKGTFEPQAVAQQLR